VELRDHLLHHCLTDAQAKAVIKQERLRSEHPAVELHGMEEWERHQVEAWLKGEGVDVRDVNKKGEVFEANLRSHEEVADAVDSLQGCQVFGPSGEWREVTVVVRPELMASTQILHFVTEAVNDAEVLHDTRRLKAQKQNTALAARLPSQRPPSRGSSSHSRDRRDRWPESLIPVQAVEADRHGGEQMIYIHEFELEQDMLEIALSTVQPWPRCALAGREPPFHQLLSTQDDLHHLSTPFLALLGASEAREGQHGWFGTQES
jgi:hypothetical protein